MRPNFESVFGAGSGYVPAVYVTPAAGIFIPETALTNGGTFQDGAAIDAQQFFWLLFVKASEMLNEANRNNDVGGIATTLTYGSYDAIVDPPGSQNVYRRDVFSAIAYKTQPYADFAPEDV